MIYIAGRLSDLISLGLNSWEAKVLFEYYEKTGQQNLLFHCLIARSQYQVSICICNFNCVSVSVYISMYTLGYIFYNSKLMGKSSVSEI